ncbi:peptidoglycan DD-metalloendopeptidase family protein [Candidatus Gottesmanbacteria bacterium]|nr:peptidoglycan DD-metalloendopeptidase family protein [Candidatus Gottesmanbacteria bacterium]
MSTSPQAEPSGTTPPAQEVLPETDQQKEESQPMQATTEPQSQPEPEAPKPKNPPISSPSSIPSLHFPFYGSQLVTFDFGAQPSDERIKKKYEEWGIVGHNGVDFGLQEGTEILACDEGMVIQAGDNGDHGISVAIKHSWGTSIYSHLQSFGVLVNDQVKKAQVIGSSGQTGFTTGPHLHFGVQPNNPDTTNGYLGYINPAPYITETTPIPQPPQSPVSPPSPQPTDLSPDLSVSTPISPQSPVSPQSPQSPDSLSEMPPPSSPPNPPNPSYPPLASPIANQEEIQKQAVAMFDARLKENSIKGNQAKKAKRDEAIQKIFRFAQERKRVTNEQIRDLLHVSQSTATDYLSQLVSSGMLKTEGKGKATVYLF